MRRNFTIGGLCAMIGLICCGVSAKPLAETVVSPPLPLVSGLRLAITLPAEWDLVSQDGSDMLPLAPYRSTSPAESQIVSQDKSDKLSPPEFPFTVPVKLHVMNKNEYGKLSPSEFHFMVRRKSGETIETCNVTLLTVKFPQGAMHGYRGETMHNRYGIDIVHAEPDPDDKAKVWNFWIWRHNLHDTGYPELSCSFSQFSTDNQRQFCEWISEHIDFLPDAHPATTVKP